METNALYEQKKANLLKVFSRQEGDFVPNMIGASCATVAWTGQKVTDIIDDPDKYAKAMTDVFADMWADGTIFMASLFTPKLEKFFDPVQNKFGPDGVTPEHIQLAPMQPDEYELLIKDPDYYVNEVLVPRIYPKLYSDREYAKTALKALAEDKFYCNVVLTSKVSQLMAEKYGIVDVCSFAKAIGNPLDTLFDMFRGFRGTLTDLRRRPKEVKAALEKIWERDGVTRMARPVEEAFPYACQMPHIPAYLSPKQFEELYWPYEKQLFEYLAAGGTKCYVMLEGRWKNVWHHFLDLPKDTCILHVDDDDIFDAYKELGHHQIIMGGAKISDLRTGKIEELKDGVKKVIDTCAPGGAFVFATDKAWIAPGDVNQNLVDVFNFVHEYSKK